MGTGACVSPELCGGACSGGHLGALQAVYLSGSAPTGLSWSAGHQRCQRRSTQPVPGRTWPQGNTDHVLRNFLGRIFKALFLELGDFVQQHNLFALSKD